MVLFYNTKYFKLMRDYDMDDWELEIAFHWPHQRFALGWELITPTEEFNYTTIKLYLFAISLKLDF